MLLKDESQALAGKQTESVLQQTRESIQVQTLREENRVLDEEQMKQTQTSNREEQMKQTHISNREEQLKQTQISNKEEQLSREHIDLMKQTPLVREEIGQENKGELSAKLFSKAYVLLLQQERRNPSARTHKIPAKRALSLRTPPEGSLRVMFPPKTKQNIHEYVHKACAAKVMWIDASVHADTPVTCTDTDSSGNQCNACGGRSLQALYARVFANKPPRLRPLLAKARFFAAAVAAAAAAADAAAQQKVVKVYNPEKTVNAMAEAHLAGACVLVVMYEWSS